MLFHTKVRIEHQQFGEAGEAGPRGLVGPAKPGQALPWNCHEAKPWGGTMTNWPKPLRVFRVQGKGYGVKIQVMSFTGRCDSIRGKALLRDKFQNDRFAGHPPAYYLAAPPESCVAAILKR